MSLLHPQYCTVIAQICNPVVVKADKYYTESPWRAVGSQLWSSIVSEFFYWREKNM